MATTTAVLGAPATGDAARPTVDARTLRERLAPPLPPDRLIGWLAPLLITAVAGVLRFWRLGVPHKIVFDEVYYVHDSLSLLHYGVALDAKSCDTAAGFVVHPPLGKWMMAFGEWIFGTTAQCVGKNTDTPFHYACSFGWRFSSAVVGTLAVLIIARVARRMFRSTLLGCIAGLLLTVESLEFVESRFGLLDIFLMFWVLAAFACLVADRDVLRRRYAECVRDDGRGGFVTTEPDGLGPRWWLLGAGICAGCATAIKWDGAWFIPAWAFLAVIWESGARRTAGLTPFARRTLDSAWWFAAGGLSMLPVLVFFHTWQWSIGAGVALLLLWELAAVRAGRSGTAVAWLLWLAVAVGVMAAAYHLVYFADTTDVPGVYRTHGPPHRHLAWLAVIGAFVLLTALAGWRRPHPTGLPGRMRGRGWQVPATLGIVPVAVYIASWAGWFALPKYAYDHDAYVHKGMGFLAHAHAVFKGWLGYHYQAFWFHEHLYTPHPYASRPLGWLALQRPVAYDYTSPTRGQHGCTVNKCAREVLALGNPAIFWTAILALLIVLWIWISRRDWRASAILVAFAVGYLTWFPYSAYLPGTPSRSRTEFIFYILDVLPFMVLAVTMALGVVIGRADASPARRLWGASAAGAYVLVAVVLFFWFYPILADVSIPMDQWSNRIWFSSWI